MLKDLWFTEADKAESKARDAIGHVRQHLLTFGSDCVAFTWFQIEQIVLLYYYAQIGSHASCTPLSITNFGQGHASLRPLSNL
jgi:hypothetical protein